MLERLLRYPLPNQIKALCEKIDLLGVDDASSLFVVKLLDLSNGFNLYERFVVRRTLKKAQRVRVLNKVMELVIGSKNDYDRF